MATILYFTNAVPAAPPSAGMKAVGLPASYIPITEANASVEKSLSTTATAGTPASLTLSVTLQNTTSVMAVLLGRYTSPQLATQDLPAQQWNIFPAVGCGAGAANTISWHCLYIWRPSTQAVVQYLSLTTGQPLNGTNSQGNVGWYASTNPELTNNKKQIPAITGVIQNGDVLVYEVWGYCAPTMGGLNAQTIRLNATDSRIEFTTSTLTYYTPPVGPVADTAMTEAADTVSADATLGPIPLNATSAMTEGADSISSTASVVWNPVAGSLTRTEANETVSSTAQVVAIANSALTEANESVSSTAKSTAGAASALTEAAETVSSTASVAWAPVTANLGVTEGAESVSSTAKVSVGASLAATEGADTVVSDVAVVSPAIADLGVTEAADSLSSDASLTAIPAALANLSVTEASGTLSSTASVAWPLIETLIEDFELPLDTAKWTPTAVGGTVTFSAGTSVQSITSAVFANEATIVSKGHYTFLGSSLFWRFVQPIRSPAAGIQNGMGVKTPTGGRTIQWYLDTDGSLKATKQDNFTLTVLAVVEPAYYTNPTPYAWLRIRESAGTVYFDAAPITASNPPLAGDWVNKYSVATSTINGPWTDTQANFYTYMALASAGVPTQPFKVDAVNTVSGALAAATANLGVTEAAETVASTATVVWPARNANSALTEGADTVASSVKAVAGASLTVTEAAETVSSTAVSSVVASLAVTEGADTASSTATVVWPPVSANLGVTEGNDNSSSLALVTTPTSLYFTDAVPGQAPTAGDKATTLPLFYNRAAAEASTEGTADTVAPNNSNVVIRRTFNTTEIVGAQSYYFGRFTSLPLAAQTIPAQNWNYAATVGSESTLISTYFWPVMYVWRPSNNTVVGYIFDASANAGTKWPDIPAQQNQNFAGASVPTQAGDLLVIEAWASSPTTGLTGYNQSWYTNSSTSKIVSPYPIQFSGAPITANSVLTEGSDIVSSGVTVSAPVANVTATDVAETLSATVKVSVSASLTVTEGTDTVLGIESTAVVASLAVTEAQDTLSSSVSVVSPGLNASLVATEANDAVSASAVTAIGGSLARTEANDSLSASASSPVTGNLAKQEGDDYTSSIARTTAGAGLGVQEVNDILSSSVSVVTGYTANLTAQEGPDQLASSATVAMVTIIANASMVEGADFTYGYAVKPKKRVILVT